MLKDTFVCNGIQSRLRHVADYPLARSKEEAIQWFEGVEGQSHMGKASADAKNNGNNDRNRNNAKNNNQSAKKEDIDTSDSESFSSYGTTQVNILTLQEVPVLSAEEAQRQMMADPFGGFGALPPSGMLNPFGSIFGGVFGGGFGGNGNPLDPQEQQKGDNGQSAKNSNSWMRGSSRSVSSSTRTHRDEHGKRVVTTVTETTIVDADGKRRTEAETTVRHLDEGGRVETKKVVHTEGGDKKNTANKTDSGNNKGEMPNRPMVAPSAPGFTHPLVVATADANSTPFEVAVIDTETLFGVAITDSEGEGPDDANYQPSRRGKSNSGWRKTEFLFRLGRFIPPFMVVSQYYENKEADKTNQKEEYHKMRQRQLEERLAGAKGRHKDENEESTTSKNSDDTSPNPLSNSLTSSFPVDSSKTQQFLEKVREQMEKNAKMMKLIALETIKPDFPAKVRSSGEKIVDNFGPTAERAQKLMKDVFELWVGWGGGDDRDGRRR